MPTSSRSPRDVLESHLNYRQQGELERDLAENYAPDVVLLSAEGVNFGHDGVRRLASILHSYVGDAHYQYDDILLHDAVGMLQWSAHSGAVDIHDGADSYLIRDGRIQAQTIHYSQTSR